MVGEEVVLQRVVWGEVVIQRVVGREGGSGSPKRDQGEVVLQIVGGGRREGTEVVLQSVVGVGGGDPPWSGRGAVVLHSVVGVRWSSKSVVRVRWSSKEWLGERWSSKE